MNFRRTCSKCGKEFHESIVEDHHIVPKFLGGTDADGRLMLCRGKETNDCHMKLHKRLKEKIKEFTFEWLKEGEEDDTNTT